MQRLAAFYKRFIKNKSFRKTAKLFSAIARFVLFRKPYILIVETGTVCNINCPTCPTPRGIVAGSRTAGNMDLESFKKMIGNAHRAFSAVLLYWSNEPLLNRDIAGMVRSCNEKDLYTFISTNVMLLNEEKGRELIEAGLDELLVCVDGFSPETYEHFRKGAKFETVKRNIEGFCETRRRLNASNPWIEIQYIETKQNSHEIDACRTWAKEAGVDGFRVQSLYITEHLQDFQRLREEFCTEKDREVLDIKNSLKGKKVCRNAESTVCVHMNGQLTICCYDIKGDFSYGNLLESPFENIAASKRYQEIRSKGRRHKLSICKKC